MNALPPTVLAYWIATDDANRAAVCCENLDDACLIVHGPVEGPLAVAECAAWAARNLGQNPVDFREGMLR